MRQSAEGGRAHQYITVDFYFHCGYNKNRTRTGAVLKTLSRMAGWLPGISGA